VTDNVSSHAFQHRFRVRADALTRRRRVIGNVFVASTLHRRRSESRSLTRG
jgi:hypothetical protein